MPQSKKLITVQVEPSTIVCPPRDTQIVAALWLSFLAELSCSLSVRQVDIVELSSFRYSGLLRGLPPPQSMAIR